MDVSDIRVSLYRTTLERVNLFYYYTTTIGGRGVEKRDGIDTRRLGSAASSGEGRVQSTFLVHALLSEASYYDNDAAAAAAPIELLHVQGAQRVLHVYMCERGL